MRFHLYVGRLRRVLLRFSSELLETWLYFAFLLAAYEIARGDVLAIAGIPGTVYSVWASVWVVLYTAGPLLCLAGIGSSRANIYVSGLLLLVAGLSLSLVAAALTATSLPAIAVIVRIGVVVAFVFKVAFLVSISHKIKESDVNELD